MKKINLFLTEHGLKVVIFLLLLNYSKSCSVQSDLTKIKKKLILVDSLPTKRELETVIKIEGLKSEKRMIQSTDRKLLDVNRQSQIDVELNRLEKNN